MTSTYDYAKRQQIAALIRRRNTSTDVDLNDESLIDIEERPDGAMFADEAGDDCKVSAFVGDLEARLEALILRADMVVGCMAWLTNQRVIAALAGLPLGCQVVVQKEDWLRPDSAPRSKYYENLRAAYDALGSVEKSRLPGRGSRLSYLGEDACESVRCAGVLGQGTRPRLHHKFLVLLRRDDQGEPQPYAVWTGSFNATENATRSRENAVYIASAAIGEFYLEEWFRALAMSEPLDWYAEYIAPQWRIGS